MNNNFFLSIIIPHFNLPKLLDRCLFSIPQRDDIEIIVVDDNSPKEALDELQLLEKKYPNVVFVYNKYSGGGGHARNIGIQNAHGEYLLFADSDDYFNYCLSDIVTEYTLVSFDCIFFNSETVDSINYHVCNSEFCLSSKLESLGSEESKEFYLRYGFGQPWCKMVRRELIASHNIQFEETIIHNDTQFSYLVGYYAKNISIDPRSIYCYTIRQGSVAHQKKNDDQRLLTRISVFSRKYNFLNSHGIVYPLDKYVPEVLLHYKAIHDIDNYNKCRAIIKEAGISNHVINNAICKYHWERSIVHRAFTFIFRTLRHEK